MSRKPFELNGQSIEAGSSQQVNLSVGKLPTGNRIYIRCHVFHAEEEGPVLMLIAGIHGDEINGIFINEKVISGDIPSQLKKGTLIVIPITNVFGFLNFRRDLPDGKDVNRSFPGMLTGSLASRVAKTITKKLLPIIDYGIDLHTGGASRYNYPQIRYTAGDTMGFELAKVFHAPLTIKKNLIARSFRKTAKELKKSVIVFEGGESLRRDEYSIEMAYRGIQRVLKKLDMIEAAPWPEKKTIHVTKTTWIRASDSGLFRPIVRAGDEVEPKQLLGYLLNPYGDKHVQVLSKRAGVLLGANNAAVVHHGDALFHIGYEYETL